MKGFFLPLIFDELDKMEEERRLFYVAMTRAEDRVFLLYSTNRRLGSDELLVCQVDFWMKSLMNF